MKAKVDEKFLIDKHSELNAFIEESIQYCEEKVPGVTGQDEHAKLNELFRKYIL